MAVGALVNPELWGGGLLRNERDDRHARDNEEAGCNAYQHKNKSPRLILKYSFKSDGMILQINPDSLWRILLKGLWVTSLTSNSRELAL
jgi:hypothetical protein